MSNAAVWFLLSIATGQYVGPMPADACHAAERFTADSGIVCRESSVYTMCPFPERPGSFTACPVFDLPKVTIKP